MPYDVRRRGQGWVVVRRRDTQRPERTVGRHDTRDEAERHRVALEAAKRRGNG